MKKPPAKRRTIEMLDPELAEAFPDSVSVNAALRALVAIAMRAGTRKRT